MAHKGRQDRGLALGVPDNWPISKRHGARKNMNCQQVVSKFDPDLKDRLMEFIRKERVSESMMDFLRLASEFYLASYQRSGGLSKRRFPRRSAGEELDELEILQKAKEDKKVRPRLVLV